MKLRYLSLIVIISFVSNGCNLVKPVDRTIPTYIHIDSFTFKPTNVENYGSSSHDISTIWVYYNDGSIGTFDLPATFPVIANGTGVLQIAPAIAVNGISDNEAIYPFYSIDTNSFIASPGQTMTVNPTTQYISGINVRMNETFDIPDNTFTNYPGLSVDSITRTTDASMVFEGQGAGYIHLTKPGDSSINISKSFMLTLGSNAFCEFNFKSNLPFYVGLQAIQSSYTTSLYYLAGVNPKDTWQKFYLNLQSFVTTYPADEYKLVIKTTLPASQADGYVLLDNIKVLN